MSGGSTSIDDHSPFGSENSSPRLVEEVADIRSQHANCEAQANVGAEDQAVANNMRQRQCLKQRKTTLEAEARTRRAATATESATAAAAPETPPRKIHSNQITAAATAAQVFLPLPQPIATA